VRSRFLALPVAVAAAAVLTATAGSSLPTSAAPARAAAAVRPAVSCPAGTFRSAETDLAGFAAGAGSSCRPPGPEAPAEVMAMRAGLAARSNGGEPAALPGAFAAAVAQHQALARTTAAAYPTSSWIPVGKGPLNSDVPGFTRTNSLGLHQLSGRIEDLAYDPAVSDHFFAAVANGGIWVTNNGGSTWRSMADNLPTQITGAVDYLLTGHRPTVLAGTGDPAFGGTSFSGLGVFWTADNGASWHRASGVPAGTLTFSFAHDPAKPAVVYAATSKGLYRSADAGRTFRNVLLPTTCSSTTNPICFFANMVTDVVVRPANRDGSHGGAVLAAVGWRAGKKLNAVGKPQAPRNGLYYSPNGLPGSFAFKSNASGFAPDDQVGRTALGVAVGPRQNHDYVYAVVQDAQKFNKGATSLDLPDATGGKTPGSAVLQNTVLNGIYGSSDFGKTWTKLADAVNLAAPGTGSALEGAQGATYAPGIQSWYNEWIRPDPTTQDEAGVPGRIAFGLEEVWSGPGAIPAAPNTGQYKVVGKYFAGTACGGLTVAATSGYCPFNSDPTKPQSSTTHPDQHAGLWIPDRSTGGVTLLVGNDGGAYKQKLAPGAALNNDSWGNGINNGFHDLLPYDASMSRDGTVVEGLQDNGSAIITPEGKQIMAYGGDGFFVAIDPDNENVWWEEYTGGDIRVSTDGGKSWNDVNPGLTSAQFATPFVMDQTNAKHLVIAGREVAETAYGQSTTGPTNFEKPNINQPDPDPTISDTWKKVFDLGTAQHPGDENAGRIPGSFGTADPTTTEVNNAESAVDTRGDATYVGYCGYCDIVTGGVPFQSGIATNVGGATAPKRMTSNGWHIAAAKGLPERYINSVRIDPRNNRTVYVTLGGYARRWIPPGSLGDSVAKIGKGHLFKSTDAGATFKDISGNLPDIGADDAFPWNGGLVVANDLGVYWAPGTNGGTFSVMGKGLPAAPVFRLNPSPRSSKELIAASYGRGVYRIVVPGGTVSTASTSSGTSTASAGSGIAGAAPAPIAEQPGTSRAASGAVVRTTPVASSRPFYRQPVVPVALVGLLGLFAALAVRRRRLG
jgi:MYXO-CTERM domain-containing protein